MTFKIIISSAIVSAFISVIGSVITTVLTQRSTRKIAQDAANQEIQRLERTWEHEDLISSDDEFAEMASAVAKFIFTHSDSNRRVALERVAFVRSKESGKMGSVLDELYQSIKGTDFNSTDKALTKAIDTKRHIKCTASSQELT